MRGRQETSRFGQWRPSYATSPRSKIVKPRQLPGSPPLVIRTITDPVSVPAHRARFRQRHFMALAMPRRRFGVSSALLFLQLVVSTSVGAGQFDTAPVRWKCGPGGLRLSGLEGVNCRPTRAHPSPYTSPYGERPCRPALPCLAAFTVPVKGASSSI
jgi:hypothetical protein